jgi:hypothetical protein
MALIRRNGPSGSALERNKYLAPGRTKSLPGPLSNIGRETARRFLPGEAIVMRRRTPAPLNRMEFPLTLAGHLRRVFDGVVLSSLPRRLAELVRRVDCDETNAREGAENGQPSC